MAIRAPDGANKKGICKNTIFFSDLTERVHLVDSVSNSEQNFDININISYSSNQVFRILLS